MGKVHKVDSSDDQSKTVQSQDKIPTKNQKETNCGSKPNTRPILNLQETKDEPKVQMSGDGRMQSSSISVVKAKDDSGKAKNNREDLMRMKQVNFTKTLAVNETRRMITGFQEYMQDIPKSNTMIQHTQAKTPKQEIELLEHWKSMARNAYYTVTESDSLA